MKGKTPLTVLGRPMSCSWWRIPFHSAPLLGINCPPLTFQSPLIPPTALAHTILQRWHQQFRSSWSGTVSYHLPANVWAIGFCFRVRALIFFRVWYSHQLSQIFIRNMHGLYIIQIKPELYCTVSCCQGISIAYNFWSTQRLHAVYRLQCFSGKKVTREKIPQLTV
jgi:hypothetical protein